MEFVVLKKAWMVAQQFPLYVAMDNFEGRCSDLFEECVVLGGRLAVSADRGEEASPLPAE